MLWREIKGYEGIYEISNEGNVRNIKTGKILKLTIEKSGYIRISLYDKNGKTKRVSVHRLVANAFIENPLNKPCVNHIDNNRSNNKVENLEWVTYKENMIWARDQGRMYPNEQVREKLRQKKRHLYKPVIGTDTLGNKYYFEKLEATNAAGYDSSKVSLCCRGIRKSVGGLKWEFANKGEV